MGVGQRPTVTIWPRRASASVGIGFVSRSTGVPPVAAVLRVVGRYSGQINKSASDLLLFRRRKRRSLTLLFSRAFGPKPASTRAHAQDARATGEDRLLVHETNRIAEGILGVEADFAPRAFLDRRVEGSAAGGLGSLERCLQILHDQIDVVRVGRKGMAVAVGGGIEAGEDRPAAVEIMPAG